ncbi:MAG: Fe-S cluster assembly protein SufD [Candidatus Hydrogenedentota bacterium]
MTEVLEQLSDKEPYIQALSKRSDKYAPAWLRAVRETGAKRFHALHFPTPKDEEWRFTDVRPIVRGAFEPVQEASPGAIDRDRVGPHRFDEKDWTELVFVDGVFAPGLSRMAKTGKLHVHNLAETARTNGALARERLDKIIGSTGNIFNALNSAFLVDGVVIHVPRGYAAESPVHVLYVTTGKQKNKAIHPRNLVVLEDTAALTLVESYIGLTEAPYFNNVVTEAALGDGAVLKRYKVLHEGRRGYHLSSTRVHQSRNSVLHSFSMFLGGKIGRNDLRTCLNGEGTDASLSGLYLAEDEQSIDNATGIEHAGPHCTSRIWYKGVLNDASHAVFTGKIYVHRGAQKTDSNQLNSNMLLSDKATLDTKPVLEIFADDVKCTHGATAGQPPKDQLFYFQSRGISEAMARALLTCGFASEVVADISLNPLRTRLQDYVYNRYSPRPANGKGKGHGNR